MDHVAPRGPLTPRALTFNMSFSITKHFARIGDFNKITVIDRIPRRSHTRAMEDFAGQETAHLTPEGRFGFIPNLVSGEYCRHGV